MCDECGWEELLEQIDDMMEDEEGGYDFAADTLEGIKEWVTDKEHCTEGQQDAVENIDRSVR